MQFCYPDSAYAHVKYAVREIENEESFCRKLEFSNHVLPFRQFTNSSFSLQTYRLLQRRR